MTDTIRKYLDEVKARCENAALGPWIASDILDNDGGGVVDNDDHIICGSRTARKNSTFIAHAREDIPRLLALVERLRAYADHDRDCEEGIGDAACDCGFDRVRGEKK